MAMFLGISHPAYLQYEKAGTKIPSWILSVLLEKKNVNPLYLLTGKGDKFLRPCRPIIVREEGAEYISPVILLVLLDEIAAGPPREITDYPAEEFVPFQRGWFPHPNDTFLLKVRGDSMTPEIPDNSWVAVDIREREPRGGYTYALRSPDGCVIRRLLIDGDTLLFLPNNPSPKNRVFYFSRPPQNPIIGRIIWVFKKL